MPRPTVIVFDVNETLSDLSPMADRFQQVGAPPQLAGTWFASVLRDGFALSIVGQPTSFASVADSVLRTMLTGVGTLAVPLDDAVTHVMDGFAELPVHPDVVDGIRALHRTGFRLATLTNGATGVADGLLNRAGIRDVFERLLSVQDAPAWKPDRRAYDYAAQACDVPAGQLLLVAVHPWDIDGAARAGLQTGWLDRNNRPYPAVFHPADHTAPSLPELADRLSR